MNKFLRAGSCPRTMRIVFRSWLGSLFGLVLKRVRAKDFKTNGITRSQNRHLYLNPCPKDFYFLTHCEEGRDDSFFQKPTADNPYSHHILNGLS